MNVGRDEEVFEPAVNLASPRSGAGLSHIPSGNRLPTISVVLPSGEVHRSSVGEENEGQLLLDTTHNMSTRSGGESPLEMKAVGNTVSDGHSNDFIA